MARCSGIFYIVGWLGAAFLALFVISAVADTAGLPWLAQAGTCLVLAFTLLLIATYYWLAWGGKGARAAGMLLIVLYTIAFGWLVPAHSAICRLRARIGPSRDLFRGITRLREARVDQAVLALDRHLQRKPKDIGGLTYTTLTSLKLRRYDEGLRYLDVALAGDGHGQTELLRLRALLLSVVGASEDALHDIDAALATKPKHALSHFSRALILVQAGRVDEALEVLRGPASPKRFHLNWYALSLALSMKGETAAAAAAAADAYSRALCFLRTMRLLGPMPWDETGEALTLAGMGKLEQGERAAIRTLARNPGDQEALLAQALVHTCRGETDEALRVLEKVRPNNPFAVVQAARDPSFAPLAASPRFPSLLDRASKEYEERLHSVRRRPGILPDSA